MLNACKARTVDSHYVKKLKYSYWGLQKENFQAIQALQGCQTYFQNSVMFKCLEIISN